jgi:N-acetylglucosamine malate deacetylase 1
MIKQFKKVLIVAPHPDDETLGVGGTIKKFSKEKIDVSVLVIGGHLPPVYDEEHYKQTEKECRKACKTLGVKKIFFLKKVATKFNEEPIANFNKSLMDIINRVNPEAIFIPFPDRHIDHKVVFKACMVCTRPKKNNKLKIILAYETLSETHWNANYIEPNFIPDVFINISNEYKFKEKALKNYSSQIKNNKARNIDAIKGLAAFRGSQNNAKYCEAFKLIRFNF